jgi:uncharacterized repeat protein (TIGR01451 family)
MSKSPDVSVSARPAPWPAFRLARLVLPLMLGSFICGMLMALPAVHAPDAQAAPPARPLAAVTTNTLRVVHTTATTHEMSVFANGRITDQFRNENGVDQINSTISHTTIAVMFDQHISTTNAVDAGSQGEFSPIGPISLYTFPDYHFYPQYTEDTGVVYASRVLSYQVTQRTLATTTNNCVIMELDIRNTGGITTLTGGKLLYMVDIDVALLPVDDRGGYDSARRLVYLKDERLGTGSPSDGYAMGISLLEGSWRGYGVLDDNNARFPDPALGDARLRNELITPTNAITDGNNDVAWIVANIPDLAPGGESSLAFGLCARFVSSGYADDAAAVLITTTEVLTESFEQVAQLSASKTAAPPAGGSIVVGEPITYQITISNTGCRTVGSIVVTDTLPAPTDLITYCASQGSITVGNRLVTASVGSLSPGGMATVTLVARLPITTTAGTIISNQAHITSNLIVTNTSIITHRVVALVLTATKRADPAALVGAGERLTYTIVISNGSQGSISGVVVSDTLPANTQFVAGSIGLTPPGAGITGTLPPTLATGIAIPAGQSVTVTYAVTVSTSLTEGTIITNTAAITRAGWITPATAMVTNTVRGADLALSKSATPGRIVPGQPVTYTLVYTNYGPHTAVNTLITDVVPVTLTGIGYTSSGAQITSTGSLSYVWRAADLAPGAGGVITITGVVSPGLVTDTSFVNNASIASTAADSVPANNAGSATTAVVLPRVSFSSPAYSVSEGAGPAVITVTLDTAPFVPVTVNYATGDGTAVAPGDYLAASGTLTFTVGQTSRTFTVTVVNDTLDEGDETVTLTLSNPGHAGLGATNPATLTIVDDDQVTLSSHKDSADATGLPLFPADSLIYTITVTNTAALTSQTNVVITDSVPTSTTLVAGSVQSNADEVSVVGDTIVARRYTLGPGQVFTLTFRVTVGLGTGGATITNQAQVASDQQPNPTQPPPTADVVTTPAPGLVLDKWADPDIGSDDSWTQYHFLVTNTGNMPLTDIQIWDDHLSPIVGPFSVPDLPAGGTYLVRRWWPVSADVTNVATVTTWALGFPDPLSASDDAFFDAVHPLNLAFDVSVEPEVIPEAQIVTYTYCLTNIGIEWMTGGTITDTQWGVIASGLELAPGAAYTQIVTQLIATTTVNVARARGFNLLGVEAAITDSATVTVGALGDYTHTLYLPIIIRDH